MHCTVHELDSLFPSRVAISISKTGERQWVVIPKEICEGLGLDVGDFVEVQQVSTPRERYEHSPSHLPARAILYPGCWATPLSQVVEARVGGQVLVYCAAHPGPPAQTVVSTCKYGDGSCQPSQQCP